ncbi:Gfo/Idh/MocA family oxidoreductase [bacterium]|jgi:predicted dehydrogenase|nr:Gfo/Idh/MocA family oxidoreductase [bacterium]
MQYSRRIVIAAIALIGAFGISPNASSQEPLKVVIIGLVHGHANGLLRGDYRDSLNVVGIHETNPIAIKKYRDRYDLDENMFVSDLHTLLDERKPDAAWVFTNTFDHLAAVEACAPRGIHVIVEKPLAVDMASANRMAELARGHGIHLLTNLETTWYSSLGEAYRLTVEEKKLGELTKIVTHFGHAGPAGLNPDSEFFQWLTDPKLNGGGASADFGCYGGNITTWLMENQRPLSVTAVFKTIRPKVFKKVDDDATIILEYPNVQAVIQASWNWTFPRKDVHIYGRSGIIRTIDPTRYDIRLEGDQPPAERNARPLREPYTGTIEYFTAVIRGEIVPGSDLSSLENNLIATEILEAARKSAETGKTIHLARKKNP